MEQLRLPRRAELGHLVCYSWNRGCPCQSRRAAALQGHCHSPALLCPCAGHWQVVAPPRSLSKGREGIVAAGRRAHRALVSPEVPALVTKPSSGNSSSSAQSFWLQALPKAWLTPWPSSSLSPGLPGDWSRAAVLLTITVWQWHGPMAAPWKTLCWRLPTAQAFLLLADFLMPVILELAQAQVFHGLGRKENSQQKLQDLSPVPALANVFSSQHSCSPAPWTPKCPCSYN